MRHPNRTVVALLGLTIVLSGCTAAEPESPAARPSHSTSTQAHSPTPAAAAGTRVNPYAVGTMGRYDPESVWSFTGQSTDPNATAAIMAANEFNEQPAAGQVYVSTKSTISLADSAAASAGADPYASFTIAYVGNDGNTYEDKQCAVPAPDTRYQSLGTMYGGATAVGSVCAIVPSGAVAGGAWSIRSQVKPAVAFFSAS